MYVSAAASYLPSRVEWIFFANRAMVSSNPDCTPCTGSGIFYGPTGLGCDEICPAVLTWTASCSFDPVNQQSQHTSNEMAVELLSQADGYGIICGLSVLFCGIILVAVRIQRRYLAEDSDQSEMFMVANRSVGTGLTCSAVFSSWM
jgi:hypothetical protein